MFYIEGWNGNTYILAISDISQNAFLKETHLCYSFALKKCNVIYSNKK
jgi:hypothetical protein